MTRVPSIGVSSPSLTAERTLLAAYSQLKLLKKVYERYMNDNRHNWDTQSAFATYVKGN